MESSLTFNSIVTLFGIMVVGAVIPGVSVLTVSARSAAFGFVHGLLATVGIMVGDIIFIVLAIFGLSLLADTMGSLFVLVKYLGAVYLIWLGVVLWRSKAKDLEDEGGMNSSLSSSFLAGLLITLADQKAILFYLGFFPAFLDLPLISFIDTGIIILLAIIAIGGAKLSYAFMADRAAVLMGSRLHHRINMVAGTILIMVGALLVAKA